MRGGSAVRPGRHWVLGGSLLGVAVLTLIAVFPAVDASRSTGARAPLGALQAGGVEAPGSRSGSSGRSGAGSAWGGVNLSVPPGLATPASPVALPDQLEGLAPYVKQTSCDPVDKPGAVALGRLLQATYPGSSFSIGRPCGADGMASEHYEGRAVDWFTSVRVPSQAARAQALLAWLFAPDTAGRGFANARRLGIMYVIWNDRIWGSYAADAGWRPYSTCAARPEPSLDTACHRDHIHLSLSWAGAMRQTSFWTATPAPNDYGPCRPADLNWAPPYSTANPQPCPQYATIATASASAAAAALIRFSGASLGATSTGPAVQAVQRALAVTADGTFGPQTATAVAAFQRSHGQMPTSRMDADTWRALIAAAGTPQPNTGRPTSGASSGGSSGSASSGGSSGGSSGSASSGSSSGSSSAANLPRLAYGMRGAAVVTLQRRLGVSPASGWFGPLTWKAVAAVQRTHRLPVTGVVDATTWNVVPA